MNTPAADSPTARWKWTRWLALIVIIFAAHLGLIFAFGQRKPIAPRPVTNVPKLRLAGANDLLALSDPTLFALPNQNGFASSVWRQKLLVKTPSFRWTEPPRWLSVTNENLGAIFSQFMRTNLFATFELNFKPPPKLSELPPVNTPVLPTNSLLRITGDLALRPLLNPISLPIFSHNDVIAPSKVQVLVNPAGEVISAVLLPLESTEETAAQDGSADERALEIARDARFTPGPRLTIGRMIFHWRTIPIPATNAPAATP